MKRDIQEIPQVDLPDELTQTDLPEIGESAPHPQTPDPQVQRSSPATRQAESPGDAGTADADIGFLP